MTFIQNQSSDIEDLLAGGETFENRERFFPLKTLPHTVSDN